MRSLSTWCTTLFLLCHAAPNAAGVTNQLPQPGQQQEQQKPSSAGAPGSPGEGALTPDADPAFSPSQAVPALPPLPPATPDEDTAAPAPPPAPMEPELADTGIAIPVAPPPKGTPVHIEADKQGKTGDIYTLDGGVVIRYKTYRIETDHAEYNLATQEVVARGRLAVDGGPSDEHILADRGTFNLDKHTAEFYDVTGTLGVRSVTHNRFVFTAPNPFTLTGQEVRELGPGRYQVIRGTLTSCRLPNPDWKLLARSILVENGSASARNTTFSILRVPVFYLPYITHPVEQQRRTTGFLLPIFGNDTQRGFIAGESLYLVLGRSADATIGAEYFSRRGYAPFGQLRYRGREENFASLHFRSLFDRLQGPLNQGGQDIFFNARRQLDSRTRVVADGEYLSSYVYRAAFEQNYSAAINSEVNSELYVTRQRNGLAATGRFERFQLFRSASFGDEIRILHVPELRVDGLDRRLGRTPFFFGGEAAGTALSRSEPGFQTSRLVPRLDAYPHLALPLAGGGLHLRAEAGLRETFYGKSQLTGVPGSLPAQGGGSLNRSAFVSEVAVAPPVLEREFHAGLLGRQMQLRHTIEPTLTYRYVMGVNGYRNTLRFDVVDTLTDTNQLEYGITQHLYLRRPGATPCKGDNALGPKKSCGGETVDALTWTLAQEHYYNPTFGGAVVPGQRNVFTSTLDLTGVAFLQGPQTSSPIVSRLRARTTSRTDLEWDLDYDTRRGRLQSSNLFATYQAKDYSFSVTDARLYNLTPRNVSAALPQAPTPTAVSNLVNFNQLRLSGVYGSPLKHGLSAGANVGYDFTVGQTQYFGAQTGYNRDCCGLSVEWRKYSLGSIRNDTQYLFSFTLAGVGSAGSLRGVSRVF